MVLKVVKGKILETLELASFSAACDWFLEAARRSWRRLEVLRFHQDGSWLAQIRAAQKACGPQKKTLVSAQNIENKGPKIFLPPRSMVLKVVRGKILETLELAGFPAVCGSSLAS